MLNYSMPRAGLLYLQRMLREEHGFTVNLESPGPWPVKVTKGIVVGGAGITIVSAPGKALDTASINFAIDQAFQAPHYAVILGGWLDTKTERQWLDQVTIHEELDEALAIARERSELAVYDLGSKVEHRIVYDENIASYPDDYDYHERFATPL